MPGISTTRANYNHPNIKRLGNLHQQRAKPKRIASDGEIHLLNNAIVNLNEAKQASNEAEFMAKVSEAFKITRNVWRGRSD